MNNLLSYCAFVDARIGASEKDLPVSITLMVQRLLSKVFSFLFVKFNWLFFQILCTLYRVLALVTSSYDGGSSVQSIIGLGCTSDDTRSKLGNVELKSNANSVAGGRSSGLFCVVSNVDHISG